MNKKTMTTLDPFTIEDIAWTIQNFYDINEKYGSTDERLLDCARAVMIVAKQGFGDCYKAEDWIEHAKAGFFTSYDGIGYFCDCTICLYEGL